MTRDDIIRIALEVRFAQYGEDAGEYRIPTPAFHSRLEDFAAIVTAEKDKEIELLRADAKRLDWCISVLYRQNGKDSYLVFDTGCGCCSDAKRFDCSISGRDAIDDAIRARGEV